MTLRWAVTRDRLAGLLLFLPVPLVLFLFTRAPLGLAASVGLGLAVMLTHRLYARPFARARARRRCLWCGGPVPGQGITLVVEEPMGTTEWQACSDVHAERTRRFLGGAAAHRRLVQAGILGPLALLLIAAALVASGHADPRRYADAVNAFRLGVALTVLPLATLSPRGPAGGEPLRAPFPVHVQALVGSAAVVWLFRVVGAVWLVLALVHYTGFGASGRL